MSVVGIIPARLASSRFPAKVLADKTGQPLIRHVHDAARTARSLSRLVVATDDDAIARVVKAFGGECVMTSPEHPNGTSRLAEAARLLDLPADATVVNIQGDEPEMPGSVIDAAVAALHASGAEVATIASPFSPGEDPANPNIVKVVLRRDSTALYFSRCPIPHPRDGRHAAAPLRHVGLYAYTAAFLARYVTLPPTPLETTESLEQLRVLEHGFRIAVAVQEVSAEGIDTPEQYERFVERYRRAHPAAR